jgi:hypothetical protein
MEAPRQEARAHMLPARRRGHTRWPHGAGMPALDGRGWPDDGTYGRRNLRVKVKGRSGDSGDGRVNRPPGGEGMADQPGEQMLQTALEVIVERGYADTRIADVAGRAGRK